MGNLTLTAEATTPLLSVVVVTLDGGASLARCLNALHQQEDPPAMEVVVAHDERLGDPDAWLRQFPGVRLVQSPHLRNYPALRAAGVRATCGSVIAATEDQCIPPPRWCVNIVGEHTARSAAAIGGPVVKWRPDSLLNWAIYLREFGEYAPPLEEEPVSALTDCNVSYKRVALEGIADVWRDEFHEPQVHGALRTGGETLWLSAALLTAHQRSFTLGAALRERCQFGRLYGRLRCMGGAGLPPWGGGKPLLLILLSPLLPLLLTARVVLRSLRKGKYLGVTLLALPYLLLISAAWTLGEVVGSLGGSRSPAIRHSS